MYREKINEFIRIISESDDRECLDLMEDLISSASDYVRRVNVLEIGLMVGKYNKEGAEYRDYIEKLDKLRSNAHNSVITNVKIINRLCRKNDLPMIYQGNEEDRIEVAEFAQKVVEELFSTRRLE
jgi:26S proteasome regulatory complex component